MRIAYVSRSFEDSVQGTLNGGYSVAKGLIDLDVGIEHIEIANTGYKEDGAQAEVRDLLAYGQLNDIDWDEYDYVVCGEYGFMPWFYLNEIKCSLVGHQIWTWDDGMAHVLEAFLPFVHHVIVASPEVMGLYEGKNIDATLLPYYVDEDMYIPREKPQDKKVVVWAGREEIQKNPGELHQIAERMPDVEFHVYSSTEWVREVSDNMILHIKKPRELCAVAMGHAHVMLMTSKYETFGLVLPEGGMSNCAVVARKCFGISHSVPGATLYRNIDEAIELIYEGIAHGPVMPREFWTKKYGFEVVKREWKLFLEGKVRKNRIIVPAL